MQLKRHLHPDACGRVRGGYIARRPPTSHRRLSPNEDGHGRALLLLRGHHWAVQQGGGALYGPDVCRLSGRPWPWCWPYPVMTRADMRAGLDLLPTRALEQKAAANRQVIAVMRERLAAGEEVARMYQEPGLAWLERQTQAAEELIVQRRT